MLSKEIDFSLSDHALPGVMIGVEPVTGGRGRDVVGEAVGRHGDSLVWEQGGREERKVRAAGVGGELGEGGERRRNLVTKLVIQELLNGSHCVALVVAEYLR